MKDELKKRLGEEFVVLWKDMEIEHAYGFENEKFTSLLLSAIDQSYSQGIEDERKRVEEVVRGMKRDKDEPDSIEEIDGYNFALSNILENLKDN